MKQHIKQLFFRDQDHQCVKPTNRGAFMVHPLISLQAAAHSCAVGTHTESEGFNIGTNLHVTFQILKSLETH